MVAPPPTHVSQDAGMNRTDMGRGSYKPRSIVNSRMTTTPELQQSQYGQQNSGNEYQNVPTGMQQAGAPVEQNQQVPYYSMSAGRDSQMPRAPTNIAGNQYEFMAPKQPSVATGEPKQAEIVDISSRGAVQGETIPKSTSQGMSGMNGAQQEQQPPPTSDPNAPMSDYGVPIDPEEQEYIKQMESMKEDQFEIEEDINGPVPDEGQTVSQPGQQPTLNQTNVQGENPVQQYGRQSGQMETPGEDHIYSMYGRQPATGQADIESPGYGTYGVQDPVNGEIGGDQMQQRRSSATYRQRVSTEGQGQIGQPAVERRVVESRTVEEGLVPETGMVQRTVTEHRKIEEHHVGGNQQLEEQPPVEPYQPQMGQQPYQVNVIYLAGLKR